MKRRIIQAILILAFLGISSGLGATIALSTSGERGGVIVRDPILHCSFSFYQSVGWAAFWCSWSPKR